MKNKLQYRVQGMDCAEEVSLLKRELVTLVGDDSLGFDLLNAKLTVDTSTTAASQADIEAAIKRTGLTAVPWQDKQATVDETFWTRNQRTILTATSGVAGLLGFLVETLAAEGSAGWANVIAKILYTVSTLAGCGMVFPKAWRSLVLMRPDMNLLMTVAVFGAMLIGQWSEGATVAFLFSLSLLLESWSVGRARNAIGKLMDLSPAMANVKLPSGQTQSVYPKEVAIGSIVIIRPGDKLPLDGKVAVGTSSINQASITGESVPVEKKLGDPVFAGTVNGDGLLEIVTTKAAEDTMLAQIIRMVGDAQSKRAPSEMWVEKFAAIYTPAVMIAALLVLVVPPLLFGGLWSDWFYRSLVLLVIACPCALVISTPVSIVAALAAAAKHGVLIKGGLYVEAPSRLRAIALDKTGTITEGKPSVVQLVPMNGHNEEELLVRAGALEQSSTHPLAQAIVAEVTKRGLKFPLAEQFEIIQGKGARGTIDGKLYWLGSHRYLEERGQETPEVHEQLEALQKAGLSIVVVGNNEHVCGFIALGDSIRAESAGTISELHKLGIEKIVMLTGDNAGTAQVVSKAVGIDEVKAELLPEDKVKAVAGLVEQYGQVAMIGDGVNDAPALARASIGIAMGAVGSDAAIETADIALMSDELAKVPWLIRHSRNAMQIIQQNIIFSLAVKAIFVVLTFAGYSSLWGAIAADTGASLLVVANGLRLLKA
ncbi:MAG: heavy metal translocating P-type ATPase [Planctomycetes bacterium]|nr:heavy metal translocating P-type ATPase [Planctomycetota bacterium]